MVFQAENYLIELEDGFGLEIISLHQFAQSLVCFSRFLLFLSVSFGKNFAFLHFHVLTTFRNSSVASPGEDSFPLANPPVYRVDVLAKLDLVLVALHYLDQLLFVLFVCHAKRN